MEENNAANAIDNRLRGSFATGITRGRTMSMILEKLPSNNLRFLSERWEFLVEICGLYLVHVAER